MKKTLISVISICLFFIGATSQVLGSAIKSFSDVEYMGGETDIYSNHMVWSSTIDGSKQIFYKNLVTGDSKQITNTASPKESPTVGETSAGDIIIVWTDKRNHAKTDALWDVYSYKLLTSEEKKLNSVAGQYVAPSVHGNYSVWHDLTSKKMYVYHFTNSQEELIGEGSKPVVFDGKVVYKNLADGGLKLYDITTKQHHTILELPYQKNVNNFTFNGKKVLWSEENLDGEIQYRLTDAVANQREIIDLSPMEKPKTRYSDLAIGENYGAWVQEKNGVAQIIGADLQSGRAFQMTSGTTNQKLISIEQDLVVMKGNNGKLDSKKITPLNHQNSQSSGQSEVSNMITKEMGPEGGIIEEGDLGLKLMIPANAFSKQTKITIKKISGANKDSKFVQVGDSFEITADQPFEKNAILVIAFDESKLKAGQSKKLAVYNQKSQQQWEYMGGRIDYENNNVQIEIKNNGHYAALLYDKTFSDIQRHWAQYEIEVLTSHWITNGMNDEQFKPNHQLTRAEFAKMLVLSQGLNPISPTKGSFSDVDATHWGFEWIEAAKRAEIINGNANGMFLPNAKVTREEMMTMLVRTIEKENQTTINKTQIPLSSFNDADKISDWAKPYVEKAIQTGLIQGANGKVNPLSSSTRAEAAVVIYRLIEQENGGGMNVE
ncbi:MAG TPA: S-layer homology domain-containing protein [Bacilli bacterium]|nr:S-layer homology domain-containing protein [Bacilli bacterium]